MEVWAGLECTINRVGDQYFDQLQYAGHYSRKEDLDHFCDLGIKKIRYPVLWEKHQPEKSIPINWDDTAANLQRLKDKGIEPIAGLVHHGSGPSYVNFFDNSFAQGLADYAEQVAKRFPWINYYTPINEPLTTARFCGLYGLWYPHKKDDYSFLKVLMSECKATVLAMKAIRKINPDAKLVQTEDLGKTHSTPKLQYQAELENHRRLLGFDLLCGKVTPVHPLWKYFIKSKVEVDDLYFFLDNACPPDIMGLNYYITSERYIDENIENYPKSSRGGNSLHNYADVEAVRVIDIAGPYKLVKELWDRYKLPIAITEVHLHCTREEQLRWFKLVWDACLKLKADGINIEGITAWAILGSYGWNKLLVKPNGDYEPGVFDLRSGSPRPTVLSKLIKHLATGKNFHNPVLNRKGWWERDSRLLYRSSSGAVCQEDANCPPVLIIGERGTLGSAFARICKERNIHYQVVSSKQMDIADPVKIEYHIKQKKPWAIVNTAGFVRVDDAETACDECFMVNTQGPINLALACQWHGIKLLTFSTDLVFDGIKQAAYLENDEVHPLNIYGISKAKAEEHVLAENPDALVVRTSTFFGPWDNYNFVTHILDQTKNKIAYKAAEDVFISPTYVPDLVNASLDLLIDDEKGLWHLANDGVATWADLAKEVANRGGCKSSLILPVSLEELDYKAQRPKFSALTSNKGQMLPSLEDALNRFFKESVFVSVNQ